MSEIDREAAEPVEVLIGRAAAAVAHHALVLLGGAGYGRTVTLLAGPGNNGNDGRAAAVRLRSHGVTVRLVDARDGTARLPDADLVIDAAYGTGFRGDYDAPDPAGAPVLAVDIPSGIDGLTGEARGRVLTARRTVTFAALKPGLLLGDGPAHAGEVHVADIGLDTSPADIVLLDRGDLRRLPHRAVDAHKWHHAVWVVGGSDGMHGAPALTAAAAFRSGAGYVRLSVPGADAAALPGPLEAVRVPLAPTAWAAAVLADLDRIAALAVGPGIGRSEDAATETRRLLAGAPVAAVVDGDGLAALAGHLDVLRGRRAATVLTPHDGEYTRLAGHAPGGDRIAAARELASSTAAVVLLKGPTTVVAAPDGRVALSRAGDARLATAGSGDVLTGIVAALLAAGAEPFDAAALGAEWHGRAARLGLASGLVASDLPELLPRAAAGAAGAT